MSIRPTVYVVAGPNGAGKTTLATRFLPRFVNCPIFLNADLIAAGLSPFDPARESVRAGKLLLERINTLTQERATFGFETTLSGKAYEERLRQMQLSGYRLTVIYLWLSSPDTAIERVANRVGQGGHHVAADDIRRRYYSGLRHFFNIYQQCADQWWLLNATNQTPDLVAFKTEGTLLAQQPELYDAIKRQALGETP